VISLWDPIRDNLVKSKDIPCNNLVYFSLRSGVLHQTVVIRSNDVVWGTPHNAIQFTHLLALVAGNLGAEMGTLTYVVQNLHYYLDLYDPTLGHIINAAMTADTEPGAEKTKDFCTATDADVKICMDAINAMKSGSIIKIDQSGYWTNTIPKLLWVYINTRRKFWSDADTYQMVDIIRELPAPLPKLIYEFWKDSQHLISKAIADVLRSNIGAPTP
jgi:hypothetical protein